MARYDIQNLRSRGIFGNFDMPAMSFSQADQGVNENEYGPYEEDIPTLRSRRIFDPYQDAPESPNISTPAFPTPPPSPQVRQPIDWEKEEAEARGLYTPEDIDTLRFRNLLDNPPQMNKPGWARKLVAGGLGLGQEDPVTAMEKVLQAPYLRDMADWKAKSEPYYNAANLERQSNTQELTLSRDALRSVGERRRQDEIERKNLAVEEETSRRNKSNEEIARQKNEIARLIATAAKFDFSGEYVIVTMRDGTVFNSGVPSTHFSPIEIAQLNNATRETIATGQQQTQRDVAEIRAGAARDVADTRAAGGPDGSMNPLDVGRDRQNKLQAAPFVNSNWARFVDTDSPANLRPYSLSKFDPWFGGIDPALEQSYNEFIAYVYGTPGVQQQGSQQQQGGGQQQQLPPPPPPRPGTSPEMIGGPVQGPPEVRGFTPGGAWTPQTGTPPQEPWLIQKGRELFTPPTGPIGPNVYGGGSYGGTVIPPKGPQQQAQPQIPENVPGQGYYERSPSTGAWRHTWDGQNWMYFVNGQWTSVAP